MCRGRHLSFALAGSALLLLLSAACADGDGGPGADVAPADVAAADVAPSDAVAADVAPPDAAAADATTSDEATHADVFDGVVNAGVRARELDGAVVVTNGALRLRYDLGAGLLRLEADGALVLRGATTLARYREDGARTEARATTPGSRTWAAAPFADRLGEGLALTIEHVPADGGPTLATTYEVRADTTYVTAVVTARWGPEAGAIRVDRLSPVVADEASGGGLFVGPDPLTHRWLDNGFDMYFDFSAFVVPATRRRSVLFAPGQSSNWNAALHDPASGRSVVAGFLSMARAIGQVVVDWPPAGGPLDDGPLGEREGFQRFEGLCHYEAGRAAIPDGDGGATLTSELFYVDVAPATVFDGLEAYAARYAARIGKSLPDEVPTGWNSWGGGGGSGGLGTAIDEASMLANLEAAVDLATLGVAPGRRALVFRAWDRSWGWEDGGVLAATLAPRSDALFVVREAPSEPAVVFTSRHMLGGAVEVHGETFADGVLAATIDTVPGDATTVWVAPAGRAAQELTVTGDPDATIGAVDGLVVVMFTAAAAETTLEIVFGAD